MDVVQVAQRVKQTVQDKYRIELEHEVRFMGASSETNLAQVIQGL
ncbi:hypothetical protein JCM19231_1454 [Vibrio ishigakensis]|uniref:Uncharacterized protein n=1 Tax=Vibrio ishigakensis TaxID=1481914 RepID=A0A0B8P8Q1_9VIBR|nr:hypothetical protein JCM19231_1454 [Vibrio ishigakensis]